MKLKLGTYPILINKKKALMYPDSGAALTVLPSKFITLTNQRNECKNKITVLNGRDVSMSRTHVDITFGKSKKTILAHIAPKLKGNIVWVGYPQLRTLGLTSIDIKNKKKNLITPKSKCNSYESKLSNINYKNNNNTINKSEKTNTLEKKYTYVKKSNPRSSFNNVNKLIGDFLYDENKNDDDVIKSIKNLPKKNLRLMYKELEEKYLSDESEEIAQNSKHLREILRKHMKPITKIPRHSLRPHTRIKRQKGQRILITPTNSNLNNLIIKKYRLQSNEN